MVLINWRCYPKSSGNGPGMGKSNMELGTPREAIAERSLGIRMDHKLLCLSSRRAVWQKSQTQNSNLRFGMHYQEHGKCAI